MNNGQIWSHNQPFNNGAMPASSMAPTNSQFSSGPGTAAYQSFDMDTDHAPTPPPPFNTVRNSNAQPPAYMSQTIQQSTTMTYGMPAFASGPGTNTSTAGPQGMPDVDMEHWIQHQPFPNHVVDSGFQTALPSQSGSLYGEMDTGQHAAHNPYDVPVNTPSNPHHTEGEQTLMPAAQSGALTFDSTKLSYLMETLLDDDELVAKKALSMLYDLSKKKENQEIFAQQLAYVLSGIAMAIQKTPSSEFLQDAAGCFYNFVQRKENIGVMLTNNHLASLVQCLKTPVRGPQDFAVSTLSTLLTVEERSPSQSELDRQTEVKRQTIHFGGVEALVPLLGSNITGKDRLGPKRVILACNCLKELAIRNAAVKKAIVRTDGHSMLLKVLDTKPQPVDGKVLQHASEALKAVSAEEEGKKAIIDFRYLRDTGEIVDGIGVLIDCHNAADKQGGPHAQHRNTVMTSILYTLRNLSDMLARDAALLTYDITPLAAFSIPLLDKRLTNGQVHSRAMCAAGILCNVTYISHHRETIFSLGSPPGVIIPYLLKILRELPAHPSITEAAVNTLKHLTYKHRLAQDVVRYIGSAQHNIEVIVGLLGQNAYWETMKGLLGLIKNLSNDATNRVLLRNTGLLNFLLDLLHNTYAMMFAPTEQGKIHKSPESVFMPTEKGVAPVKTVDILRGTIDCLDALMDDHGVMEMMLQCVREQGRSNSGLFAVFYQLLQHHFVQDGYRGAVRHIVTDILGKMTTSANGSSLVKSFAPELLDLLHNLAQLPPGPSGNQSVAQNSKKAIYNMTADRSADNFQQSQLQMMQQSAPSVTDIDGFGYTYHQYHASGPPSMHGSTYGSVMSVANSDILSDFDAVAQTFQPLAEPSRGRAWNEQASLSQGQVQHASNGYGSPSQPYQHRSGTSTPLQISTSSRNSRPQTHQMQ